MDYLKLFLFLGIIGSTVCIPDRQDSQGGKSGDDERYKILKALIRKVEALEAKQKEQEKTFQTKQEDKDREIENRLEAIEKRLSIQKHQEKDVKMKKNVKQNDTSDLEERVSDLELGLIALADDLDELEESQNTQDQRFLAVEADINQLDDANFALDTRVDSLEITSALHSEQISVLEQSVSLLDEKADTLEVTDTQTLESLNALESNDQEMEDRIDQLEYEIGEDEGSANNSLAVCYGGYRTLTEDYRRVGETGENCDNTVIEDGLWYRFELATGENGLLDTCPQTNSCGTSAAIWVNTEHPHVIGERMQSYVQASYSGNCDHSGSHVIEITKCYVEGERFYLYRLWQPGCDYAYCVRRYDNI